MHIFWLQRYHGNFSLHLKGSQIPALSRTETANECSGVFQLMALRYGADHDLYGSFIQSADKCQRAGGVNDPWPDACKSLLNMTETKLQRYLRENGYVEE